MTGLASSKASLRLAVALLVVGVLCFVGGGALAWGASPLFGFMVGGVGTVLLVVGAILARNSLIGRYLDGGDGP